jgi:SAM-dependent methyltransferase
MSAERSTSPGRRSRRGRSKTRKNEGWEGWDEYAPFYDWENARTLGRRDVPFWRQLASQARGRVLELGCGTGRVAIPMARAGIELVGIDRSGPMLARAVKRMSASRSRASFGRRGSLAFVRGDIRALPFRARGFAMVLAPYGVLQSLLTETDLAATLESVRYVLRPGGTFGLDLVPDVPNWREYRNRVQLHGRVAGGGRLTLIESVRQDRRRHVTTFEQRYVERRESSIREHRFELTFRTLSLPEMTSRLERSGFAVDAVLGDYRGGPWDPRSDVWILVAKKV